MEKWAFTIKYNPNGLTSDEYKVKIEELLKQWQKNKVEVISRVYEDQDKMGHQTKIHMHGIISMKRGIYRKKLQKDGYHIKLVAYKDGDIRWDKYIVKNLNTTLDMIPELEGSTIEEPEDDHYKYPRNITVEIFDRR